MQMNNKYRARGNRCVLRVKVSFVLNFFLLYSFQTRIPFMGDKESRVSPAREGGQESTCIAYICVQPIIDPS
jgi:hypothetical protein